MNQVVIKSNNNKQVVKKQHEPSGGNQQQAATIEPVNTSEHTTELATSSQQADTLEQSASNEPVETDHNYCISKLLKKNSNDNESQLSSDNDESDDENDSLIHSIALPHIKGLHYRDPDGKSQFTVQEVVDERKLENGRTEFAIVFKNYEDE